MSNAVTVRSAALIAASVLLLWLQVRGLWFLPAVPFVLAPVAAWIGVFLLLACLWRKRDQATTALSELLDGFATRPWLGAVTALAFGVMCVRYYFGPGEVIVNDAYGSIPRAWAASEALRDGVSPYWSNYFYLGCHLNQFYGSLYFLACGFMTLLTGDPHLATKLLLGLAHVASGWTMALFVRKVACDWRAGLLAGLAYVLSFAHPMQVILYGNRHPLGVVYALLPLAFLCFEGLLATGSWGWAAGLAASLAACTLTHHGFGFYALLFLGVYAAARLALRRAGAGGTRLLWALGVTALLFACWTAFSLEAHLVPPDSTSRFTGHVAANRQAVSPASLSPGDPTWIDLVVWSNGHFRLQSTWQPHGVYVGLTVLLLAAVGAWSALRSRHPAGMALTFSAALSLAAVLLPAGAFSSIFILRVFRLMGADRLLFLVVFHAAALAGLGASWLAGEIEAGRLVGLARILGANGARRAHAGLLLLVLLDLLPTTVQSSLGVYPHLAQKREVWESLRPAGKPTLYPGRILTLSENADLDGRLTDNRDLYPAFSAYYSRLSTPLGCYVQGATRSFSFAFAAFDELAASVAEGKPLPAWVRHALALQDVQYIVSSVPLRQADHVPAPPRRDNPVVVHTSSLRGLLWASHELRQLDTFLKAPFRDLVTGARLEPHTNRMASIPVPTPGRSLAGPTPQPRVTAFSFDQTSMQLEFSIDAPAFLLVSESWARQLEVRLDGVRIAAFPSSFGLLAFESPPGAHRLSIEYRVEPLQLWLMRLSLAVTLIVTLALVGARITKGRQWTTRG